jgi:Protein of unknown function (DUF3108)
MWNKCLAVLQEPAYKRLGIALCVSALLHFFLVGNFYKLLPDNKPELHTIEARLQMPKTVAKPTATLPAEAKPQAVKPKPIIPKQAPPKPIEPVAEEPVTPQPKTVPAESNSPQRPLIVPSDAGVPAESQNAKSIDISDPLPAPADAPTQAVDEGAVTNENAYQTVETTFNVSTKIGGSPEGKATMTYHLDGTHFQINSVAKAGGLASLLLSDLVQTSEGVLTKTGLQPNKFTYNYGDKTSKSRLATFDWQTKMVSMQTAAGVESDNLPDDTQDLLSFMYQFMYVPPLHKMQIPIVNGKSLRTYDYSFEGEEVIALPMGDVNTIHIQHSNNENEEKIELWLAVDYQHLPVKILKIDKNGKIYEFKAVNLNTSHATVHPANNY